MDPEKIIGIAKKFYNNYSNEIPREIIHGSPLTHKVQRNWFQVVVFIAGYVMDDLRFEKYTRSVAKGFTEYISNSGICERVLIEEEDITMADSFLEQLIHNYGDC